MEDKIKIRNKKTYTGNGNYVERGTALGNPFALVNGEQDRDYAIDKYKEWLWKQIKHDGPERKMLMHLVAKFKKEGELNLICYCAPKRCHAEVIKAAIMWIIKENEK